MIDNEGYPTAEQELFIEGYEHCKKEMEPQFKALEDRIARLNLYLKEWAEWKTMHDNCNQELRDERDALAARIAVLEAGLEKIAKGTHEEYPTCMMIVHEYSGVIYKEFGPPITMGWEGWAKDIQRRTKQIARDALGRKDYV